MDQRQKKFYDILVNGGSKDNVIVYEMMKYIPDDFSGKILEIPARRSKVVYNKLSKLKNADITCVDSDKEALAEAEKRFAEHKIANAKTIVGNIDNKLEFEDDTFDIVLSINGFDTFSNKNRAISQTLRVLKKGGMLIQYDIHPFTRPFSCEAYKVPQIVKSYHDVLPHLHWRIRDLLNAQVKAGFMVTELAELPAEEFASRLFEPGFEGLRAELHADLWLAPSALIR
jgi:ubiquinone/menaquinone biosynthesis C-methylase UbiE